MTDLPHPLPDLLGESYTLGRELGRGGMATVYLAHDHKHDRSVALKHAMSLRDDLHTATALRRFEALPHDVFWGALDRVTEGRILAKRGRTEEALNLLDRAFS